MDFGLWMEDVGVLWFCHTHASIKWLLCLPCRSFCLLCLPYQFPCDCPTPFSDPFLSSFALFWCSREFCFWDNWSVSFDLILLERVLRVRCASVLAFICHHVEEDCKESLLRNFLKWTCFCIGHGGLMFVQYDLRYLASDLARVLLLCNTHFY